MEQVILYVVNLLIGLADKHQWLSIALMVIGGLYVLLMALRGFLTGIVKLTKTKVDDTIVEKVFAFLDKFSYGFGPLKDYYEGHVKKDKKESK